jgi:ligand-binding sensor domain-containing protein
LLLFVAACSPARAPEAKARLFDGGVRPAVTRVEPGRPRVVEVLTAPGEVRGAAELDGALWLATAGGLLRTTPDLVEEARFTTLEGLPSNDLSAVAADGERLWLATAAGLVRARVDGGQLVDLERVDDKMPHPPLAAPGRPVELEDGRRLTIGDGARLFDRQGSLIAALEPVGLPSPELTALAVGDEWLYVGTADHGLVRLRLDREAGTLDVQPVAEVAERRILWLAVRPADGVEELWVGTPRGTYRIAGGAVTHFGAANKLPDKAVEAILAESDGVRRRWAGALGVADGLPGAQVTALASDGDTLWVATRGGLARVVVPKAL